MAIPKTSSEDRNYIPIGFLGSEIIVSTDIFTCPDANDYHFGVLTSSMHMAWVRTVCGRMKSDYRYSAGLVYNCFPWPTPTDKQKAEIVAAAGVVLVERAKHAGQTLANLYDRTAMPPGLVEAHAKLDRLVEKAYQNKAFESDRRRFEFLFAAYQKLIAPLIESESSKRKRRLASA